jgi:hypothetical protein
MILTEEEAKTKICCGPLTAGASPAWHDGKRCVASRCMAWRWVDQFEATRTGETAQEGAYPTGVLAQRGFCGLAGKVEP